MCWEAVVTSSSTNSRTSGFKILLIESKHNYEGIILYLYFYFQIVSLYNIYKHSCFLYLGSIFVDELSCETENVPGLLQMLQAFINPTFDILQVCY